VGEVKRMRENEEGGKMGKLLQKNGWGIIGRRGGRRVG